MSESGGLLSSLVKLAAVGTVGYVVYRVGVGVGEMRAQRVGDDNLDLCSRDLWALRREVEAMGTPKTNALAAGWHQSGWKPRQSRSNPGPKKKPGASRR